jgi:glutathione S-transferase
MGAIMAHPAFVAWRSDARGEPWRIPDYEAGHTVTEVLAPLPVSS